jgi:phosphoglycolate phosphatase
LSTNTLRSPSAFTLQSTDAFVFDIDGTLLNTRDLVHWNALARAMKLVYGIDGSIEGIPYHGMTDISILRAATLRGGVSELEFESNLPEAIILVSDEVQRNLHLIQADVCSSIRDVLEHLQASGKLLGVASGNFSRVGWTKLSSCELARYFRFGSFCDQCGEQRRDIFRAAITKVRLQLGSASTVCFVGDTPSDIEAARDVGAPIVSVATGVFSREKLLVHGPDACVNLCAEFFLHSHVLPEETTSPSRSE